MMYLAGGGYEITEGYNYDPFVLTLPEGNYTGPQMAAATYSRSLKWFLFHIRF